MINRIVQKINIFNIVLIFSIMFSGCVTQKSEPENIYLPQKPSDSLTLDKKDNLGFKNLKKEGIRSGAVSNRTVDISDKGQMRQDVEEKHNRKNDHSISLLHPTKSKTSAYKKGIQYPDPNYFNVSSTKSQENSKDLESKGIVLNFDNADLYEVIRTMAELLHINYIVNPGIKGSVTIQTSGYLKAEDLFTVFYQILEANGLTAVKEGSLYKIIPMENIQKMPIIARYGKKAEVSTREERIMMQIVPLNHISSEEMTKLLTTYISDKGSIISHENSNTLLIIDRADNILKLLKLINAFDIDIFQALIHRFYRIRHVDAEDMVDLLSEILSSYGKTDKTIKLIAISRLNTVLAIGLDQSVFNMIETFIQQLDTASDTVEPGIYVYFVKNGEAEELSDILNTLFNSDSQISNQNNKTTDKDVQKKSDQTVPSGLFPSKKDSEKENKTENNPVIVKQSEPKNVALSSGNKSVLKKTTVKNNKSGSLKSEIRIIPDKIRNALIIEAIPLDYRVVEGILNRIDVLPRQVLIEVVIAEISLDGKTELGVEWSYGKGEGGKPSTSLLSANMGLSGLQYIVGQADRWSSVLSALATENKANILSTPVILASDNKKAEINVSDQIPVASAEYIYDTNSSGVTQTNIQYRNTGIILSVTPHINERGLVSMDISQEVSEEGSGKNVGGKEYPSFKERKVDTSLTVRHGQTLVMGGLMRERAVNDDSGVPFLSKIPVIGFLFGKKDKEILKTELILLITPRVIVDSEDVDAITQEFRQKVENITGNFKLKQHP